jgi:predicted DNA-binding transcriptional regulator YafY
MGKSSLRKAKVFYLQDILLEETDDEHGLTMPELIQRLESKGIPAERKAIYDDLETLKEHGLDIITRRGTHTEYAIGNRSFELPELLLLADAVQSSRFLTKGKSEKLVAKLHKLTSRYQRTQLDKSLHVEGRIKMQNESIYYNIDAIQAAIRQKLQITFNYQKYSIDKTTVLRKQGKQYQECPVGLIYKDDYYYLVTYNEHHEDFVRYRVDRMLAIKVLDQPIPKIPAISEFSIEEFAAQAFGMFGGEPVQAVLVADQSIIDSIIDQFGKDVEIRKLDESTARVHVKIIKSTVFFSWLALFGSQIKVEGPSILAEEYCEYLQSIVQNY